MMGTYTNPNGFVVSTTATKISGSFYMKVTGRLRHIRIVFYAVHINT